MAYNNPFDGNITKHGNFTGQQQTETWAERTLAKVNNTKMYNWPVELVRKTIMLGENRGTGVHKIAYHKPLPNNAVKGIAIDQTSVQDPVKGAAGFIQVTTQRYGVWMMATDTMASLDSNFQDWKIYYRKELSRLFLYKHQEVFKALVDDDSNTNKIGTIFSDQADGSAATTIAECGKDISWPFLTKVKFSFDLYNRPDAAGNNSTIETKILPDGNDTYTVVLDSVAHNALINSSEFLNYTNTGVRRPEVDSGILTGSYMGMRFRVANSPWLVKDSSNNVRNVGIFLGGGTAEPAFARVAYSSRLSLTWIEKDKTGFEDPLNQIYGTVGWKGDIGYGIIYPESARRLIYKRS